MKPFIAAIITIAAVFLDPVCDQAFAGLAVHPNLWLAPLAIWVSLCPGAPAVIGCGILGLILDCLSGPQLGARAACFCLLAAGASIVTGRWERSWPRTIAAWCAVLFAAEIASRVVTVWSLGGTVRPAAVIPDAALSTLATTILLGGLWLAARVVARSSHRSRSSGRLAATLGRAAVGD